MGPDRFRFFNRLPANAPVRPPKIPRKSLFRNILRVTPTRSIFCADFRLSPSVFSIFYEQGGGGRPPPNAFFPLWEATRNTSTQSPATSYQSPLMPSAIAGQLLHDVAHE